MKWVRWSVRAIVLGLSFLAIPLTIPIFAAFCFGMLKRIFGLNITHDSIVLISSLLGFASVFVFFWIDTKSARFKEIKNSCKARINEVLRGR